MTNDKLTCKEVEVNVMIGKQVVFIFQRVGGWCESIEEMLCSALEYLMMNYDGIARYSERELAHKRTNLGGTAK